MKKIHLLFGFLIVVLASCSMSEKSDLGGNTTGTGGSLARFTFTGDYLYTVNQNSLTSILVSDAANPVKVGSVSLGIFAETIFPYENKLLLGTQTGMYIYGLTDPVHPVMLNYAEHLRSCDPVVAENGFAYVTLNTGNQRCSWGLNELQIYDIRDISNIKLKSTFSLSTPLGLAIHNDSLFVCDNGVKIYNVADKQSPVLLNHISNEDAIDVIYNHGYLIVIGATGLHQYKIEGGVIEKVSTLKY